ncbi:sensor histidine kinase YxjM [Lentibacillus populi]|uniref:histidine kinase n=1 Tax=Lentibacillus populi TaxID=1827502 RepID=A0A9W5TWX7_9BACI|nr:sensor histidine kinase [Lentibacillus populi]MBT2214536.1 sensor histidine kinase [Virgibacillus dakarensis]GGB41033.1 sensor histidine kinase YxjM [Lentibacillus populi]
MKSYWLWLLLNILVWPFSILYLNLPVQQLTVRLFGVALYFIIFFIIPIVERKPNILASLLSVNAIIATMTLFPYDDGVFNPYFLLIVSLVIAEGFYRLAIGRSFIVGGIGCFGLLITVFYSNLELFNQVFIGIYMLLFLTAVIFYKRTKNQSDELDTLYQALFNEYREIKRRVVSEEEMVRQEERVLIAHEIHDSVGHKLTALVMQLEAFRLQTPEEHRAKVQSLKELASESLQETRSAVKSLKASDSGGLPGILRLIRKLEMESMIRIYFSIKHGAFTAPLTGEQTFIIYRSVQEALTNIMKHSNAKEAEIVFEAPGGSVFRFEITNPLTEKHRYQEGFGLSSMRERLEKAAGGLTVYQTEDQFIVRGFIKISNTGDENDSNTPF